MTNRTKVCCSGFNIALSQKKIIINSHIALVFKEKNEPQYFIIHYCPFCGKSLRKYIKKD